MYVEDNLIPVDIASEIEISEDMQMIEQNQRCLKQVAQVAVAQVIDKLLNDRLYVRGW